MEENKNIFVEIAKVFGFVDGEPEYLYVGVEKVPLYLDPRGKHEQTRFIYKWGNYIVKVDDGSKEGEQCFSEVILWEENHGNDLLLPILDWGYFISDGGDKVFWIIQEFIEIDKEKNPPPGFFKECAFLRIYDVEDDKNWGYVNGYPVVYDYGV